MSIEPLGYKLTFSYETNWVCINTKFSREHSNRATLPWLTLKEAMYHFYGCGIGNGFFYSIPTWPRILKKHISQLSTFLRALELGHKKGSKELTQFKLQWFLNILWSILLLQLNFGGNIDPVHVNKKLYWYDTDM